MLPDKFRKIGFLTRPHGIDGTMILKLYGDSQNLLNKREFLFVSIDQTKIPFLIEEMRISGDIAFIKFADTESEEEASIIREKAVYLTVEVEPDIFNPQILEGFKLIDESSGITSEITDFIENPENPLIQVRTEDGDFLVPVNEDFIVQVNEEERTIVMRLPVGIFNTE